jgi:hypothetical protein
MNKLERDDDSKKVITLWGRIGRPHGDERDLRLPKTEDNGSIITTEKGTVGIAEGDSRNSLWDCRNGVV